MNVLTRRLSNDPFLGMINEFFGDSGPCSGDNACGTIASREISSPLPIDISETDTHLIVRANVPGFTRETLAEIYPYLCVKSNVFVAVSRGRDEATGMEVEIVATLDRSKIPVIIKDLHVR